MKSSRVPKAVLLLVWRICATGWTGAASLFVLITVQEILSAKFESIVLDQLVLIRFPLYYGFSLTVLGLAAVSSALYCVLVQRTWRWLTAAALSATAFLVLTGDYLLVYSQLVDMLTPLGSPRPHTFPFYHQLTETLNGIALILNLAATILVCLPLREDR
ncbi:hypothetical protein [Rubinisphaera margarita]|uniref:hypothetical protein n=1 Tax=Rubinisphaera margarita TaxID=2909586 RepID=UPI001EE8E31C|nr:hypothetical protein [Rubinisphaera margarita]MCG6156850.1 hypothetical protein [Rubinisphaera margarita]